MGDPRKPPGRVRAVGLVRVGVDQDLFEEMFSKRVGGREPVKVGELGRVGDAVDSPAQGQRQRIVQRPGGDTVRLFLQVRNDLLPPIALRSNLFTQEIVPGSDRVHRTDLDDGGVVQPAPSQRAPVGGGPAGEHDPYTGALLVKAVEGSSEQAGRQLVEAVEKQRDTAAAQQLRGGVGAVVGGPQVRVVPIHCGGGPCLQRLGGGVPATERQPHWYRDAVPGIGAHDAAVLERRQQQQDHRAGLAGSWAAEKHQPAMRQLSIDFVVQPGHHAGFQRHSHRLGARAGQRHGSGAGRRRRGDVRRCCGDIGRSPPPADRDGRGFGDPPGRRLPPPLLGHDLGEPVCRRGRLQQRGLRRRRRCPPALPPPRHQAEQKRQRQSGRRECNGDYPGRFRGARARADDPDDEYRNYDQAEHTEQHHDVAPHPRTHGR
jgi:hypothetical protein